MKKQKKQINQQLHTIQLYGETVDVLHILGWHGVGGAESACALCGFKIRNGNHSWMVQQSNGLGHEVKAQYGIDCNDGDVLLPVDLYQGSPDNSDPKQISLGFFQIGSECRKQLPAKFVVKWVY